jgi:ribosome recycling factor
LETREIEGCAVIDEIMSDTKQRMAAAVDHTRGEFAKIRTGRANPGLITDLPVEYYGTNTPLQQLAGVSVPEARMLVVTPYDQSALKEIERSISQADIGVNPSNDGQVIRIVFPDLTEERRKEYVKRARERAEEGRISIRNSRREAKTMLGELQAEGEITEDEERRAEGQLQGLTDRHVGEVDELLAAKEKELLEV